MKKTTNISPDKCRSISQTHKIKFDLNPLNYQCFISDGQKLPHHTNLASPSNISHSLLNSDFSQRQRSRVSELRIPFVRRNLPLNSYQHSPQFNNLVLLMNYDKDQVYTDSIQKLSNQQIQIDSKSVHSETSEENQIVRSCLKMLNEQTDTNSSSPPRNSSGQQNSYYSNVTGYYSNQNPQLNSFSINLNQIEIDGRTTIMIRNIPNKYTENLLLDLFNKNHKKKIDFFYLPMDYKNNCNVGYAFLNFVHPNFIEEFYTEFHNKKWKLFNSQKICHICYARIQGATQLSNHFESSNKKSRFSLK